ncbi:MAG: MFS transporter [Alphaproteobacteria bacterium]|nr:MFS transporter [Alphaproteobacteria bacterium]
MGRTPVFLLAVACVMLAINMGVRGGFGLFLRPISHEYGWPLEVFSLSMAIQALVWGISQPFAGALADRYGTLRLVVLSGLAYAGGVLMMAWAPTPGLMYLASFIIGVAISGTSFGVVFGPVARVTPVERRSTALGIATAGASFGMFIGPVVTERLIASFGWVWALCALAGAVAMVVPLAPLLAREPAPAAGGPAAAPQSLKAALAEASSHSGFWYLTAGFFVCGFHVTFIATHLPAFIASCGLAPVVGGWSLALVGLFNVVGSYGAGVLGGKWRKKYLLSWLYFGRAVVIGLFMVLPKTEFVVLGFAAAMGLLWLSTVPLTSGLVAQIFGPQHMATLFGIVFVSHQVGSFLGGWLGGVAFDRTGSYDLMWAISILLGLGAAVMHLPIGDRPVARLSAKPA